MAFNPDAYLASTGGASASVPVDSAQLQSFDPDVYLAQSANQGYDELQGKYGDIGQQALAGAEGLAGGFTGNLSERAEVGSGLTTKEDIAGRAAANPLTHGAGNIVGVGGLLYGTGGGASALLPEAAGTLATVGTLGAEGGAYNAFSEANHDLAMGDPNLNAQKIISDFGIGFGTGATLGFLGKAVGAVLPPAAKSLSEGAGRLKNVIFGSEETPGLTDKISSTWAQKLRDGIATGNLNTDTVTRNFKDVIQGALDAGPKAASEMYDAAGAKISSALEDMPVDAAKRAATDIVGKIRGVVSSVNESGEVVPELSSKANTKILNDRISALEETINSAKTSSEVHDAVNDFAKQLGKKNGLIKWDALPTALQSADQAILKNINSAARDFLKNAEVWGKDAAMHYGESSDLYNQYSPARDNFIKAFTKKEASASGTKRVIDIKKVKSYLNNISDPAMDDVNKYVGEYFNQLGNLTDAAAAHSGIESGADSISAKINDLAKKRTDMAKIAEAMQSSSSAKDPMAGIQSAAEIGSVVSGHPAIAATIAATKAIRSAAINPYRLGANIGNVLSKLEAIGDVLGKADKRIASGAKAIFSENTARGAGYTGASEVSAGFDKHADQIRELSNDPPSLIQHLHDSTKHLFEPAPNISQSVHAAMTNGVQFLNSKLPRPNNELLLSEKYEPSFAQKEKFNTYFRAVNDPISALDQIKDGTLGSDTMEALHIVHPDLLSDMQKMVMENLNPAKAKNLSYAKKLSIAKFIGHPLDDNMLPQSIMANQMAMTPSQPEMNAGAPKKKASSAGMKDMKIAGRYQTRTQQLESPETA